MKKPTNAIRNAIQNCELYHIKIFDMEGQPVNHILPRHWATHVYSWPDKIKIGDREVDRIEFTYSEIVRIEIHACQFPYTEDIPWLYIYLKK